MRQGNRINNQNELNEKSRLGIKRRNIPWFFIRCKILPGHIQNEPRIVFTLRGHLPNNIQTKKINE